MSENGVRFVAGQWNAICDVCAQKYKSSEMRKRWDGLMVCPNDWEPRHPQDFLRSVPDHQAVPWSRPQIPDVFVPSTRLILLSDSTLVTDLMQYSATYNRFIPSQDILQTMAPNNRALNDQVLNWGVLGGADSAVPNMDETVFVDDALVVEATKALSDTTSMSETLLAISASALNDSVNTQNEYLSVTYWFTQQVLNEGALNSGPL